jgi:predicted AAA+ superfamily ATPase
VTSATSTSPSTPITEVDRLQLAGFYERIFMNDKLDVLVERLHALMDRVELVLPRPLGAPDWSASVAFRYRKRASGHGALEPVAHVAPLRLEDLKEIDPQKEKIQQNTEQFVQGLSAINVLLTGDRGTGKSSLIKACLNHYAPQGLRLIEVDKADLTDLPIGLKSSSFIAMT